MTQNLKKGPRTREPTRTLDYMRTKDQIKASRGYIICNLTLKLYLVTFLDLNTKFKKFY